MKAAVAVEPRITPAQAVFSRGPFAQALSSEWPAGGGEQAHKTFFWVLLTSEKWQMQREWRQSRRQVV